MSTLQANEIARHAVAFHVSDDFIVRESAAFIAAGLGAGERVIALCTQAHWNAITKELERGVCAVGRASADGRLVLIEADQLVETLTSSGRVDADVFRATLAPLITPGVPVRIYGEVVSLLATRGDVDGALAIERLGHELAQAFQVQILCGYHVAGAHPLRASDIARIQQLHDRSAFEEGATAPLTKPAATSQFHAVRFYQDGQSLARMVSGFLEEGFSAGLPAVVIATPEHRDAIETALSARQVDVSRLKRSDDLVIVDAERALSTFMVAGMPDPASFKDEIIPLIERACRGRTGCVVRAYGEMVDVLWKRGETNAAIRLEALWNQLAQTHEFALLCGYSMGHFYKSAAPRELFDLHTHVWSGEADDRARTAH
jgi:hypothetical protein